MIDRNKLPYRPGDIIYLIGLKVKALIIGYYFPNGYNVYKLESYGYAVKILEESTIKYHLGPYVYTYTGNKIENKISNDYFWVLTYYPVKIIKRAKYFLCQI